MTVTIVLKELVEEDYEFDQVAEDVAKQRGLVVVCPQDNQLQLDLDSEEAVVEFKRRLPLFFHDERPTVDLQPSASGVPHYHATVSFQGREFEEWERIALQSVLGSDPMREYLNAKRLIYGVPNPTRLFELPKEEANEQDQILH